MTMRLVLALFAASLIALASPLRAGPSQGELEAVATAQSRGAEMYAYDQAAWHATDRFFADIAAINVSQKDLADRGIRGYVVEPGEGGGLQTTFFGQREGRFFAFARYRVEGSKVTGGGIVPAGADSAMSALSIRMIAARELAIEAISKSDFGLCSESSPNTLILPPGPDGNLPVYILTSTTENGVYPAGGHYRFDFDPSGKLVKQRRFMKSCFPLDFRKQGDRQPVQIFLSHLLDPQPTEIHVFVSLNIPVGLMIMTMDNRKIWSVERGKVSYERDMPGK